MKMKRNRIFIFAILAFGALFLFLDLGEEDTKEEKNSEYVKLSGGIFGTTYNIIYFDKKNRDLLEEINTALNEVNLSLSTYDPNSVLSKINNNMDVNTDKHFNTVYTKSREISELTDGAFDITVGPLVRFWGFGFDARNIQEKENNSAQIDSLLKLTGYLKVEFHSNKVSKKDERIRLDASAIAKGYGVDVVAELLSDKGITNYMVEIGGEIVCSGQSPSNEKWKLGVDKPIEDPMAMNRELQTVLHINNAALATSGSYRQFYYKGDKRFSHTINPKTGFPVEHNLLSATVIAPSCMEADGLATACMVLGVEQSIALAERIDNIEVYLIYSDENKKLKTAQSSGFNNFLPEQKN